MFVRALVWGLFLSVLALPLRAQLLPPPTAYTWVGTSQTGVGFWTIAANWLDAGGSAAYPPQHEDLVFANSGGTLGPGNDFGPNSATQGPRLINYNAGNRGVNSMWFDTGPEYVIHGSGEILLGGGAIGDEATSSKRVVTVQNTDPYRWQSETNIEVNIRLAELKPGWTADIANYSRGGLRFANSFNLNRNVARVVGGSAVHFAGLLSGHEVDSGLIVATNAGHVILSASNGDWRGKLQVDHGFLVATEDRALGAPTRSVDILGTWSGATLAFRPKLTNSGVNYSTNQQVVVQGVGFLRPWGSADNSDPTAALNLRPVGAIYNDGGDNLFAGDIIMVDDTWFGSRAGILRLTGNVVDKGRKLSFTKVGRGAIELAGSYNEWYGATILRGGVLRSSGDMSFLKTANTQFLGAGSILHVTDPTLDPGASGLGGVLELPAYRYDMKLGSGAGEVRWMPNAQGFRAGGFSTHGGDSSISLNGGALLNWMTTPDFIGPGGILILSSTYSDANTIFANPIDWGQGSGTSGLLRTIHVDRGVNTAARATLAGTLFGQSPVFLVKSGTGTLWLSNKQNSFVGLTAIFGGVLGGYIPNSSNISFGGGVLGLNADFTRSLGFTANQVQWGINATGHGGFAAYGADRTVQLSGLTNDVVTFDDTSFVKLGNHLIFGAPDADHTVVFNNRLRPKTGRVRVIQGTAPLDQRATVVFNKKFYTAPGDFPLPTPGSGGGIYFEGDGRIDINQLHEEFDHNGVIIRVDIRGAQLRLNQSGALMAASMNKMSVHARHGGSFFIDNRSSYSNPTGGYYVEKRIPTNTNIQLHSGGFEYINRWSSELGKAQAGNLMLLLGANWVRLRHSTSDGNTLPIPILLNEKAWLRFSSLSHVISPTSWVYGAISDRPTVNFIGDFKTSTEYVGLGESRLMLSFDTKPTETGGILPYATVNGNDWARTVAANYEGATHHFIKPYTSYQTGAQTTWTSFNVNASPSANQTLSANRSLNSLRLTNGRQVDLNNRTLTLGSGAILATGNAVTRIIGGKLISTADAAGVGSLYVHVYNTDSVGLEISSMLESIADLVKVGPGTLLLSGNWGVTSNFWAGPRLRINEGVLALAHQHLVHYGQIVVGDHAGVDVLRLDRSQTIDDHTHIMLRGGHPDPARGLMAEGIIRFNGAGGVGIRQMINSLGVTGRGVIDFQGGEVGRANYLILNGSLLHNAGADDMLFIRNWYEFEDYLLISKKSSMLFDPSKVVFEGYGPAMIRPYQGSDLFGDYYEVTPKPEPETSTAPSSQQPASASCCGAAGSRNAVVGLT